jgi:hypothetical protein
MASKTASRYTAQMAACQRCGSSNHQQWPTDELTVNTRLERPLIHGLVYQATLLDEVNFAKRWTGISD